MALESARGRAVRPVARSFRRTEDATAKSKARVAVVGPDVAALPQPPAKGELRFPVSPETRRF